jgi:hypothetical protein
MLAFLASPAASDGVRRVLAEIYAPGARLPTGTFAHPATGELMNSSRRYHLTCCGRNRRFGPEMQPRSFATGHHGLIQVKPA